MRSRRRFWLLFAAVLLAAPAGYVASRLAAPQTGGVRVVELPRGGSLPFVAADGRGTLHVAFMQGQDVQYATYDAVSGRLGGALRVNDQPGAALGGMFRGPELAIAPDGTVNVLWYRRGYELKLPAAEQGPMLSRLQAGGRFGAAVMLFDRPTDGHSLVATPDELLASWVAGDSLWVSESDDGGATFRPAEDLGPLPCECCDTALAIDEGGDVYLMYRDRKDNLRDVYLRQLGSAGVTKRKLRLDDESWRFDACPMSGMGMAAHDGELYAAWEHKGSVLLARVDLESWERRESLVVTASGKYPVVTVGGDSLLVAWKRRKQLEWTVYDRSTLEARGQGRVEATTSDRPAVGVLRDGGFVLIP